MFVIMSCLHQVSGEASVEDRVGQALRHAGTSITVTTATDVVAFSVGAVTVGLLSLLSPISKGCEENVS